MTGHKWGYGEEDGPSAWHKSYPIAQGARQSPINIVPEEAVYDSRLPAISLSYDNCTSLTISNNGHSVVVEFEDMDDRSEGELIQYDLDDRSTSYASGMDAFTIRKDPLLDLTRTMNMGDADGQSTKKHGTISLVMRQLDY